MNLGSYPDLSSSLSLGGSSILRYISWYGSVTWNGGWGKMSGINKQNGSGGDDFSQVSADWTVASSKSKASASVSKPRKNRRSWIVAVVGSFLAAPPNLGGQLGGFSIQPYCL